MGLYSQEELEPLLNSLREQASEIGFRGPIVNYLAQRVRANLHVALIMDFQNAQFIAQCESNPSLYKLCYVQWMDAWSKESMLQIPRLLLTSTMRLDGATAGHKGGRDEEKGKRGAAGVQLLSVPIDQLCQSKSVFIVSIF